jgi:hypothetical protein
MGIIPMPPVPPSARSPSSSVDGLAMMIAITIFMASSPVPVRWRLPKFLNGGNFFRNAGRPQRPLVSRCTKPGHACTDFEQTCKRSPSRREMKGSGPAYCVRITLHSHRQCGRAGAVGQCHFLPDECPSEVTQAIWLRGSWRSIRPGELPRAATTGCFQSQIEHRLASERPTPSVRGLAGRRFLDVSVNPLVSSHKGGDDRALGSREIVAVKLAQRQPAGGKALQEERSVVQGRSQRSDGAANFFRKRIATKSREAAPGVDDLPGYRKRAVASISTRMCGATRRANTVVFAGRAA